MSPGGRRGGATPRRASNRRGREEHSTGPNAGPRTRPRRARAQAAQLDLLEARVEFDAPPRSIRAFDAAVTAPRWGFSSVDEYYLSASPLQRLAKSPQGLPPTLLLQALDDPWVPAASARQLQSSLAERSAQGSQTPVEILLTARGGHNGFHGPGDNLSLGCWSDRLALAWFNRSIPSAVCRP